MLKLEKLKKAVNIAELLDEQELSRIAQQVVTGYDIDDASRADWKEVVDKAMDIAKQTMESKNTPWPNASNVKYPLITKAAIDFASRTFPEVVQNDRIVKPNVLGMDPDGAKNLRAERVAKFMSYQLLKLSDEWEESLDKSLHILPILGTVFKKVYYNTITGRPCSELCHPEKIVVNYNVQSLDSARRITHVLSFYMNDIIERMRAGIYVDIDPEILSVADGNDVADVDAPIELLEQHCYLDLDDDGYKEPYIVIVHKASGKVLRIVNRFKDVHLNDKKEVVRIDPIHYFVDFHFIKSPDGGFYSVGLGTLLYPLNAAINTLINQLIDSGTLNNNQSGFLGRGLRLKNGEFKLKLGEWRVLDAATGMNIQQNVVPLPTKEPSATLFQLLGLLIDIGKDLSSTNDALQGKQPAQNVAATTILTLVEQGMKVYNAITKRLFRSLKSEFQKIYEIDRQYLDEFDYLNVLDDPSADLLADFENKTMDVLPVADPNMSSDAQRLAKAQALVSLPTVDQYEASKYYLKALQFEDQQIEVLLPKPDPNAPPPPEVQKIGAEIEHLKAQAQSLMMDAQVKIAKPLAEEEKLKVQQAMTQAQIQESAARVMKMKQDAMNNTAKVRLAGAKADQEAALAELDAEHKKEMDQSKLVLEAIDTKHQHTKDTVDMALSAAKLANERDKNDKPTDSD